MRVHYINYKEGGMVLEDINKKVKVIVTGGTIDDLKYERIEDEPKHHKSLIPKLIKQANVKLEYSIDEAMQKNSRFVTGNDRELVLKKCIECPEKNIIITHGTITMSEMANFLGERSIHKTIVLLGAMIPANKKDSDALFNIGTAFSAVLLLPVGVYITMNGKIFTWSNVLEDYETGIFINKNG